jgi:hypothetical protein
MLSNLCARRVANHSEPCSPSCLSRVGAVGDRIDRGYGNLEDARIVVELGGRPPRVIDHERDELVRRLS